MLMGVLLLRSLDNRGLLLFGRAQTNTVVFLRNQRGRGFFREASGLLLFSWRVGEESLNPC